MARPIATRWRWPPESWRGLRFKQFGDPQDRRPQRCTRLRDIGLVVAGHPQAKAQILLDRHVRIERVGLEHHGDAAIGRLDIIHNPAADRDLAAADHLPARRSS